MSERRVRIGIDVGGTFTHAVAIDAATQKLIGKTKVPTTHDADEGVARGVVQSLLQLLERNGLTPEQVLLIAHSTTQATNALLEGDVAPVGILGMGGGLSTWLAAQQTHIKPIELAPNRFLQTTHRFIKSDSLSDESIDTNIEQLRDAGAEVIVAAEAFAVDDTTNETRICERAAKLGMRATATHHVSRLHGLRIRTRTAVINASMIPRMLDTADMTEKAVRDAGITAPLMVMRSDGGVMSIDEMRRRPILTMLSGPAAGVAAALLYARISDGIFLEVGGTSTDISAIKDGRCQIRSAEIGGHKLHVSTLDVRTVGVAGGSLVYVHDGKVTDVGPRSSHIAGLPYLSFADQLDQPRADTFTFEDDTFAVVRDTTSAAQDDDAQPFAITPTGASNILGLVPENDPAQANSEILTQGAEALANTFAPDADSKALAEQILNKTSARVRGLVEGLMQDYKLDAGVIKLIGGGGGASAIVPHAARQMNLPYEAVRDADVISAIGVALALVRDTVERSVIAPSDDDIRRIRTEAFESVLKMGAAPESVEVFIEIDAKRNLLRATAEGSTEIRKAETRRAELTDDERKDLVANSIGTSITPPERIIATAGFEVWQAPYETARFWRFFKERKNAVRILDDAGTIRWQSNHAEARGSNVQAAEKDLVELAERHTKYNDAGATIPRCFVFLNGRIINLAGMVEMSQVLEVLRFDLTRAVSSDPCILVVAPS